MYSQTDFVTAFDAEAGDVATLATTAQKTLWFNEGMARLRRYKPTIEDITWTSADRSVALPSDFVQLDRIVYDTGVVREGWNVYGETLILEDPDGASADGSARVYYWGEWPQLSASQASELRVDADAACLYYALFRFFKKLASNRSYYKKYATLVGANAVSMADLQVEADRYYQDFLDTREDLEPVPPAVYFAE